MTDSTVVLPVLPVREVTSQMTDSTVVLPVLPMREVTSQMCIQSQLCAGRNSQRVRSDDVFCMDVCKHC